MEIKSGWKVYQGNRCIMHGDSTVKDMAKVAVCGYKILLKGKDVTERLINLAKQKGLKTRR
jgi:DNA-directed RNA polymerase subunit RPC12/RpoP